MLRDSDQDIHVCYLDGSSLRKYQRTVIKVHTYIKCQTVGEKKHGGQGLIEASKTQTGGREIFQAPIAVTMYYHS